MCGIFGITNYKKFSYYDLNKCLEKLNHRGPDFKKIIEFNYENLAIGHTRLSIIDKSKDANQPMISADKKLYLLFNGEIYNHLHLRKEINMITNYEWKTKSDTETILKSIETFGFTNSIKKFEGMFCIGIYDRFNQIFNFAVDQFGQKPLYYGWQNNCFVFASELKAIRSHPSFENKVNNKSRNLYFQYGYIPSPNSIYERIYKLKPSTILKIDLKKKIPSIISEEKYTNSKNFKKYNISNEIQALDILDNLVRTSVNSHMSADVPVGSYLSSGIDSTLISYYLSELSTSRINTFCVGFDSSEYDETKIAKNTSKILCTDHNEIRISKNDLLSNIQDITKVHDEPFSDSSQIPTYFLSKFAKNKITVALTGDGADEIMLGYDKYLIFNFLKSIQDTPLKIFVVKILEIYEYLPLVIQHFIKIIIFRNKFQNFNDKLYRLKRLLYDKNLSLIDKMNSLYYEKDLFNNLDYNNFFSNKNKSSNTLYDLSLIDQRFFLSDNVLQKTDMASMKFAIENRAPFLSNGLSNFMNSLPINFKIYNGQTKYLLKKLLKSKISNFNTSSFKKGFNIPINECLRDYLKEWVNDFLHSSNLISEENINIKKLHLLWKSHLDRENNYGNQIWRMLIYLNWKTNF